MCGSTVYKYTQNGRYLTDEQRRFYDENGYIMFRNLVSPESLDEYQQRFLDICNGKVDSGLMTVMKDLSLMKTNARGEFLINKIQDFLFDDVLFKYASDKAIINIVSSIIGENITAVHSMLINKPPDAHQDTSRHPLHQDLHYFPFRPADKICASWTAMERIDERNGCLFAVPGSHKAVLYPHVYPENVKNKAYHGVQGFDHLPRVNLLMEKGDTVFFHPILLHGSGPNLTKGFRKAISVHYASSDCHFVDVRGTSQQNIVDEIEAIMKKRTSATLKYEDVWRYKSRLVVGFPGEFHKQDMLYYRMSGPTVFKYTQNGRYLTDEQRRFYEENGYIMFRNLVSPESLDEYQQHFLDICNGKADSGTMTVMKDLSLMKTNARGEFLINKIQDFLFDDVLFKYASDKAVIDIVSSIIGENITAVHSMLINKPPDAHQDTSRHPLHQDLHYFPFRPADKICASWTAMERIDERNGCLFAVPGSHKAVLYPHAYPENIKNKAYHGVQGFDHLPRVNLVMEKGDTVFFHPILLHGSGPNLTKGFRKAISIHYASSDCHFIDVRGTSQQNIADEIEALVARKLSKTVKFEDVWRYKSRLVNGSPGVFQKQDSKL